MEVKKKEKIILKISKKLGKLININQKHLNLIKELKSLAYE